MTGVMMDFLILAEKDVKTADVIVVAHLTTHKRVIQVLGTAIAKLTWKVDDAMSASLVTKTKLLHTLIL